MIRTTIFLRSGGMRASKTSIAMSPITNPAVVGTKLVSSTTRINSTAIAYHRFQTGTANSPSTRGMLTNYKEAPGLVYYYIVQATLGATATTTSFLPSDSSGWDLQQRRGFSSTGGNGSGGSGSGGGGGGGGGRNRKGTKAKGSLSTLQKKDSADDSTDNSNNIDNETVDDVDDDDDDGDEDNSKSTTTTTSRSSSGPTIIVPTKLPFGESSPRLPHLLALPLVSRPLFPGLVTSVTITDERTIDALDTLHNQGNSYLACFLRSKHSSGVVSDTGVVLSTPEVISDISDLHRTGTFAQIQRFTRGVVQPKPTEYSPKTTTSSSTSSKNAKTTSTNSSTTNFASDSSSASTDSSTDDDSSYGESMSSAATLILLAHRRVDLVSVDNIGPPVDVTVRHWPRMEYNSLTSSASADSIRALSNEIISTIREVAQMNLLFRENLQLFPMRFDANDPYRLADFAASISAAGTPDDLQAVLSESDPELRLQKALVLLVREREVSKLQKEISQKVEEKMTDAQRKYFLTEQLKSIKKELGMERDDKDAIIEKYRTKMKEYGTIPPEVLEVMEAELDKFSTLERNSAEYNVTRTYLDWLIMGIPWNVTTQENFNITEARTILDRDHYGMEDIKNVILQFIAIGKLRGTVSGKILCLAGPPGTGKTSIAQSIAGALHRKFYRFSVGGLSDVSEIKGHRRTYIGAMPGKIIQCLKSTGTFNAVCLIDEIDKLGMGYRGDPASALLEVLDPSQNSTFRDHFIDVPVDISKILFICTANEIDRIPGPLLDRMEIIRLSGYDFPEKVAIAEQFLVPKSMRDAGLMIDPMALTTDDEKKEVKEVKDDSKDQPITGSTNVTLNDNNNNSDNDVVSDGTSTSTPLTKFVRAEGIPSTLTITGDAIKSLVRWYAREAGVRNLAKYIDKITRKLALQVVAESEGTDLPDKAKRKTESWVVDENNLSEYVGMAVFTSDRLYETGPLPSGIVMGLAYTSMGGTALYIETQGIKRGLDDEGKPRGGGSLKATGQLGDVMKESTQISYTVARARLAQLISRFRTEEKNDSKAYAAMASFFDTTDIHMHVPEGATPKDGPSAGVTMVTSMLSLAMDKPVRNDVAMTGEISLTGKVLAVGGIKEKIMAARRAGITHVILPDANRRDYDEIPEYLKDGLQVHYADHYDKVYDVAFS